MNEDDLKALLMQALGGLASSGLSTARGLTRLVPGRGRAEQGVDHLSQLAEDYYGEPTTQGQRVARGVTRIGGDVAQFLVPGMALGKGASLGARLGTGLAIDAAAEAGDDQGGTAGALADLTGSELLERSSKSPFGRAAVGGAIGMGAELAPAGIKALRGMGDEGHLVDVRELLANKDLQIPKELPTPEQMLMGGGMARALRKEIRPLKKPKIPKPAWSDPDTPPIPDDLVPEGWGMDPTYMPDEVKAHMEKPLVRLRQAAPDDGPVNMRLHESLDTPVPGRVQGKGLFYGGLDRTTRPDDRLANIDGQIQSFQYETGQQAHPLFIRAALRGAEDLIGQGGGSDFVKLPFEVLAGETPAKVAAKMLRVDPNELSPQNIQGYIDSFKKFTSWSLKQRGVPETQEYVIVFRGGDIKTPPGSKVNLATPASLDPTVAEDFGVAVPYVVRRADILADIQALVGTTEREILIDSRNLNPVGWADLGGGYFRTKDGGGALLVPTSPDYGGNRTTAAADAITAVNYQPTGSVEAYDQLVAGGMQPSHPRGGWKPTVAWNVFYVKPRGGVTALAFPERSAAIDALTGHGAVYDPHMTLGAGMGDKTVSPVNPLVAELTGGAVFGGQRRFAQGAAELSEHLAEEARRLRGAGHRRRGPVKAGVFGGIGRPDPRDAMRLRRALEVALQGRELDERGAWGKNLTRLVREGTMAIDDDTGAMMPTVVGSDLMQSFKASPALGGIANGELIFGELDQYVKNKKYGTGQHFF